jgi:hypothetical protein
MCPSPWKPVVDTWAYTPILPVDPRYRAVFHVDKPGTDVSLPVGDCGDNCLNSPILPVDPRYRAVFYVDEPSPVCPSPWKPVVDTWADTPILPVEPNRYKTVFHID